jgi:hypothetical protein
VAKVEKTRGARVKGNAFAEKLEECMTPTDAVVGIRGKDASLFSLVSCLLTNVF